MMVVRAWNVFGGRGWRGSWLAFLVVVGTTAAVAAAVVAAAAAAAALVVASATIAAATPTHRAAKPYGRY